ncbi:hypothetical protein Ancab_015746 [Ancistrocladus abbreviatus]
MAFYAAEEELWKCIQHPSRQRRSGICPVCLRERLSALCPDCANVRPCACYVSSASSSSSSSCYFISHAADAGSSNSFPVSDTVATVRRLSNPFNKEAAFRRSKSVALPIFQSVRYSRSNNNDALDRKSKATSLWPLHWPRIKSKSGNDDDIEEMKKMRRSKSVAVSDSSRNEEVRSVKGKGWYFPSPMKVFRQSKVAQEVRSSPSFKG